MPTHVRQVLSAAELRYSYLQIERALDQLSVEVTVAFQDQTPQCICVLPDGLLFSAMLLRRLVFPLNVYSVEQPQVQAVADMLDLSRPILLLGTEMVQPGVASWIDWLAPAALTCIVLLQSPASEPQAGFAALPALPGDKIGCGFQFEGFGANWGGLYLQHSDY